MGIGSLNKVILVGPVAKEPVIRKTSNGHRWACLYVTTVDPRSKRVHWHRVVIYIEPLTDFIERCVHEGSLVLVEGSLEVRKWLTKDKAETFTAEVVVSGHTGRLVLLDKQVDVADDRLTEDPFANAEPEPMPLSITRSKAKYGDGADDDSSGLGRFLQVDDQDRARLRAAGEPERRTS